MFGVHGDWGSGKTSFLHALQLYLTGDCPQAAGSLCEPKEVESWKPWKAQSHVVVVWFEAWRYQHESAPVVALLHEIRARLSLASQAWAKTKKLTHVAIKGALFGLESVTKRIGLQASKVQEVGEKWEKDHFAEQFPSHTLREFLKDTMNKLLPGGEKGRLVVLVDDLDRCEPQAAYRLLEGIKIYLNLPNCVFVLGVNQSVIEQSLAEQIAKDKAEKPSEEARQRARDYLDKICKNYWHLPAHRDIGKLVDDWLRRAEVDVPLAGPDADRTADKTLGAALSADRCLPANPRKIKAFVNTLARFLVAARGRVPQLGYPRPELCAVLAYLYQFHPEIYRVIEWQPAFFQELRNWCERGAPAPLGLDTRPDPTAVPVHELFRALTRPHEPHTDPMAPTPITAGDRDTFPDPARGNVFRIQKLVRAIGSQVTPELIEECLLR